jgi:hypothetical protein
VTNQLWRTPAWLPPASSESMQRVSTD